MDINTDQDYNPVSSFIYSFVFGYLHA
jgi:hypothetical protein